MVNENVLRVLLAVALFSLIPLMLALLFASARARSFTDNVLYLSTRADAISRGALEESVELKSHDELEQLAEALERLRISMQEALERLRRRR